MKIFTFLFFICFIGLALPIHAEIEKITVSWRPEECDETCTQFLKKILEQIPQARRVEVNQGTGYADIYWKPEKNFTIDMVKYPMHRLGLKMRGLGVEARGTITHSGKNFFLHSLGDSTILELLSPTEPSTSQYVVEANIFSHMVKEPLKGQLLDLESRQEIARVKGFIFMPQRSELKLVVQSLKGEQ